MYRFLYFKDALFHKFRIISKPFHIEWRGVRKDKGSFSIKCEILKNKFSKFLLWEKVCGCRTADENVYFILYKSKFLGEPFVSTAFWRTVVAAFGIFTRVTVGDRYNIKIVRIIKGFIGDSVPFGAEPSAAGIIERFSRIVNCPGRGLTDLHNFGTRIAEDNRMGFKTKIGLALAAG